jgi:hypothetical protein
VQFNTYTSSGAHIAAALVNDPMTDAAAVGALLAGFDVEEPVPSEAELADLRDWTARLRSVFEPRAEAERAELVNDLLVESDCRPRLLSHDGLPYHLHYRPLAGDLAARVKAFTAAGLAYLKAGAAGSAVASEMAAAPRSSTPRATAPAGSAASAAPTRSTSATTGSAGGPGSRA